MLGCLAGSVWSSLALAPTLGRLGAGLAMILVALALTQTPVLLKDGTEFGYKLAGYEMKHGCNLLEANLAELDSRMAASGIECDGSSPRTKQQARFLKVDYWLRGHRDTVPFPRRTVESHTLPTPASMDVHHQPLNRALGVRTNTKPAPFLFGTLTEVILGWAAATVAHHHDILRPPIVTKDNRPYQIQSPSSTYQGCSSAQTFRMNRKSDRAIAHFRPRDYWHLKKLFGYWPARFDKPRIR